MTYTDVPQQPVTAAALPRDLSWLLEEFLRRVPGVEGALLASSDGLEVARAGVEDDAAADKLCAIMTGVFSLGKGAGKLYTGDPGPLQQVVVQFSQAYFFVMSTRDTEDVPPAVPFQPATVSTLVGVLATEGADAALVGHEMAKLITSVAGHLRTPVRGSEAPTGGEQ
ncbi:roadblock/LC7 domain-containing protein [Streptomyces sp. NPDC001787]|uniref:roadblock/LC7 domain-containing protein n=1 Tax=Streptomyces sp. NPDC001787 TaxID=3154523 RepID=UPI003321F750